MADELKETLRRALANRAQVDESDLRNRSISQVSRHPRRGVLVGAATGAVVIICGAVLIGQKVTNDRASSAPLSVPTSSGVFDLLRSTVTESNQASKASAPESIRTTTDVASTDPTSRDAEADSAAAGLLHELSSLPGFVDGGYLSSSRTIEAMWHSKVPAQVSAIADRARALNINLKNQIVRFTDKELTKASNTLWDALTEAGIRISSIGTTPEYDALAVEGPLISDSLELQEKARKIALQEIGEIPLIFMPYDASEDGAAEWRGTLGG